MQTSRHRAWLWWCPLIVLVGLSSARGDLTAVPQYSVGPQLQLFIDQDLSVPRLATTSGAPTNLLFQTFHDIVTGPNFPAIYANFRILAGAEVTVSDGITNQIVLSLPIPPPPLLPAIGTTITASVTGTLNGGGSGRLTLPAGLVASFGTAEVDAGLPPISVSHTFQDTNPFTFAPTTVNAPTLDRTYDFLAHPNSSEFQLFNGAGPLIFGTLAQADSVYHTDSGSGFAQITTQANFHVHVRFTVVPEPASLALLGLGGGAVALALWARRRG